MIGIKNGTLKPTPQCEEGVCFAEKLKKEECKIAANPIGSQDPTGAQKPNSYAGGIVGETTHGLIDENRSRGDVSNGTDNPSSTKAAQAIVGNFKSYSEVSTNYKSSNLSQIVPSGMNMTIKDL